jgi:hypothetical protein
MDHAREVSPKMIRTGLEFVHTRIEELCPTWSGRIDAFEISNTSRQNLLTLREAISVAILRSKQLIDAPE